MFALLVSALVASVTLAQEPPSQTLLGALLVSNDKELTQHLLHDVRQDIPVDEFLQRIDPNRCLVREWGPRYRVIVDREVGPLAASRLRLRTIELLVEAAIGGDPLETDKLSDDDFRAIGDSIHLSRTTQGEKERWQFRGARLAVVLGIERRDARENRIERSVLRSAQADSLQRRAEDAPARILQATDADARELEELEDRLVRLQQAGIATLGAANRFMPEGLEQARRILQEALHRDNEAIKGQIERLAKHFGVPDDRDGALCVGVLWFDGRRRGHRTWFVESPLSGLAIRVE